MKIVVNWTDGCTAKNLIRILPTLSSCACACKYNEYKRSIFRIYFKDSENSIMLISRSP